MTSRQPEDYLRWIAEQMEQEIGVKSPIGVETLRQIAQELGDFRIALEQIAKGDIDLPSYVEGDAWFEKAQEIARAALQQPL